MVLKLEEFEFKVSPLFENDVKMYGTQTGNAVSRLKCWFENDVKMYGTQTAELMNISVSTFENDVKMYGTQTPILRKL